jgi:arginyl-tRNA synthetase
VIKEKISTSIKNALKTLGLPEVSFVVEHPEILAHGDYSTNVAMALAKQALKNPKEIAEKLVEVLNKEKPEEVENVTALGGFINFHLSKSFFQNSVEEIIKKGDKYGTNNRLKGEKTIIEYTDPNPFKEFHIGHLMSNTIGESISRLIASQGAEVKRACYQGDVGLHVAKAIAYAVQNNKGSEEGLADGVAYTKGSKLYSEVESFKAYVLEINKKIYNQTDKEVESLYEAGKKLSLKYFDSMYKKLGTYFDYFFFESTTGEFGKAIIHENPDVFEKSDGAIVYRGEKRDPKLHTRVFINSEGLPTYEAKELGLAKIKYDTYPYQISVVITGNEINDYFKVLLSAMKEVFPELAEKTHHISHGMLRLPTGKMSSRTGDVITTEALINEVKEKVAEKINSSDRNIENKELLSEQVAVSALKYSILKQATGRDIIFDFDKSISFEGDSGPYLQYTNARANSIIEKAHTEGIEPKLKSNQNVTDLEKILYRFPEVVERASREYAPHYLVTYLTEVASMFNSFYANEQIINAKDENSSHKVALTQCVANIIKNGLNLLAIPAPERM